MLSRSSHSARDRVFVSLVLPLAVLSMLLAGCGVPIAPEAITATAVAQQASSVPAVSTFGGSSTGEQAQELRTGSASIDAVSGQALEPLTAPASLEVSPSPEAEEAAPTETPEPEVVPTETPVPEPTETPAPPGPAINPSFTSEFLDLLNAQRTGRGLGPVTTNIMLTNSATDFAGYMGTGGFFGHDGPDGSTPAARISASGYSGAWKGEALSAAQKTPQAALNALLASRPHAAILLDPSAGEVGVGYAYVEGSRYGHYWVVITGSP